MTVDAPRPNTANDALLSMAGDTLAVHFATHIGSHAVSVAEALETAAEGAKDEEHQAAFWLAASTLAALSEPLTKVLVEIVRQQFELRLYPPVFGGTAAFTLDELALADEAEIHEDIAINTTTLALKEHLGFEFFALSRRIAHLCAAEHPEERDNPVFPGLFVNALRDGLRECGCSPDQRLLMLEAYDAVLHDALAEGYRIANEKLVEAGVLLDVDRGFRGAAATNASADAVSPAPVKSRRRKPTIAHDPRKDDDITNMLRQMLLREEPAFGERSILIKRLLSATGSPTETDTGLKGIGMLQENVRDQVELALLAQRQLCAQFAITADSGGDTSPPPAGGVSAIEETALAEEMTLAQLVTSCIIINAFNRLLASPAIRDHVGAFLLLLQPSVIKATFAEPHLLTDAAHPVRVSLDRLAEFAIGQPALMQPGHAMYESIAVIIDCVAVATEYDSVAYASVADNISELFAYEEETAAAGDAKAAMMMEIEITEIAINAATRAIEVRLEHDESTPEFVATFVRVIWKDVLFQDVINGGGKGELWLRDIETLDTLLKSIHAQESVGARSEMLRRLPVLMGNLEEGAQSVGCDPPYLTAFISQLRELHTAAWNAPFQTAGPPLVNTGDDPTAAVPPGLKRGQWVEFPEGGGRTRRARLNWLSPIGGNCLFKDYLKNETFTVELKDLKQQLHSGRAQLVRSLGISRHAIEYAIKHLGDADAR